MHPKLQEAKTKATVIIEKMLTGWIIPSDQPDTDETGNNPPLSEDSARLIVNARGTLDRSTPYEDGSIYLELTLNSGEYQGVPVEVEPIVILGAFDAFTGEEREDLQKLFESWALDLVELKVLENAGGVVVLQRLDEPEQWVSFSHIR